jgi:hypothetical protein
MGYYSNILFFNKMHTSPWHDMACPQAVDGGLKICSISNHEQLTWDGPPAWGLVIGVTNPHHKNPMCYEMSPC